MCLRTIPEKAGIAIMVTCIVLFIIAIVEFGYASSLASNETLTVMMDSVLSLDDKTMTAKEKAAMKGVNPFQIVGSLFASLTIFAMLVACVVALCATRKCHNKCCAVIYIIISSLFFLGLAIGLLAAGAVMSFPTDKGFIEAGCQSVADGKLKEITPESTMKFFKVFDDLDTQYKQLVNEGMCTEMCKCECKKG